VGGSLASLVAEARLPKNPNKKPDLFTPKTEKPTPKGEMVTIAADLKGYAVRPTEGRGPFPAVVVIMEAFGLNAQIKSVCDLYAKYGYVAIAPDLYYGDSYGYDKVGDAVAKLKTLNDEKVVTEFGQTLDYLGKQFQVRKNAIGTIGFCMGGRYAFLMAAAHGDRIKASVSFYGGGIASNPDPLGRKSLLDRIPEIKGPTMLIYSAEDEYINAEEHARITQALSAARKRYNLVVIPNTQHGFMNDQRTTYNAAAAMESWDMAFGFFKKHVKGAP
jgi:carboxymethylenebutenolidase